MPGVWDIVHDLDHRSVCKLVKLGGGPLVQGVKLIDFPEVYCALWY